MQEIETKIMSLLEIKRIRSGLTDEEKIMHEKLNKKYRDEKGHLLKGSYFVDSTGNWTQSN